ncbi:hypothetical protein AGMMS50233_02110 [Endomicrobiia bacterium]|nr:hypothetical protein AGMMS50233_02110 [Endomicrobiia bacterium]
MLLKDRMQLNSCYLTIKEASLWATNYLGKEVTTSNISYLIQYGCIRKIGHNGSTQILKSELEKYYCAINKSRESSTKVNTLTIIPYSPYDPKLYDRWTMAGMLDLPNELKVADEFWDFFMRQRRIQRFVGLL